MIEISAETVIDKIESRGLSCLLIAYGSHKLPGTDIFIGEADFSLGYRDHRDYFVVNFSSGGLEWVMICFPGWMKEALDSVAEYCGFIIEDSPSSIIVDGREVEIIFVSLRQFLLDRSRDSLITSEAEDHALEGIALRWTAYA